VFYLKLFGGAAIEATLGPLTGPAVQRSRMALIALLVATRGRGMTRDKLIAYLWADADSERGRRYLSDSVYRINQAIGAEAVTSAGDLLRVDTEVLRSDLVDFEDAVEKGEHEAAAALYVGPFLDGFFLSDSPEFERWVDIERDRLSRMYGGALEALAETARLSGYAPRAAEWWRRRANHDPLDSRVALSLMKALEASGARAAAIQHARVFAALMRQEIGTEPDVEIERYAELLRRSADAAPGTVRAPAVAGTPTTPPIPAPPAPAGLSDSISLPESPPVAPRPRRRRYVVAAIALVVLMVGAAWIFSGQSSAPPAPVAVAVLPFIDLSPARDQEYFSDGISEELINTLSQIEGIQVSSRTSAFAFKGKGTDVREIGRALRASHIVEGSVRRTADRFRISVQLVNVADGYHVWTETYDGEMRDVLTIETDIARAVAEKLQGKLIGGSPSAVASHPAGVSPEAHELYMRGRHSLYLKGRYAWYRRTEEGMRSAATFFQQAVDKEPRYARAHAGLGDAYAVLGFYDYLPPHEAFAKSEQAATRSIELDPTLGAPHTTLGYINLYYHWNWPRAESEFRRAIALDPNYSTAHQWYANFLTAMSRFDEAEREMRRAQELDPLSLIANAALGWVYYYAAAFDKSVEQCRQTLELDPQYAVALLWSGWALQELGRFPEAIDHHRKAVALTSGGALYVASLARAHAAAGDRPNAMKLLRELETRSQRGQYVPAYELAKIHAALGDHDRAFDSLGRALKQRAHSMVFLEVDPQLRSLRDDPRYAGLVRDVGLDSRER
jgi:TolB-like protein/DNA-binding SARP family transcriptional activator/Tfp pilus assembly protein PilF